MATTFNYDPANPQQLENEIRSYLQQNNIDTHVQVYINEDATDGVFVYFPETLTQEQIDGVQNVLNSHVPNWTLRETIEETNQLRNQVQAVIEHWDTLTNSQKDQVFLKLLKFLRNKFFLDNF